MKYTPNSNTQEAYLFCLLITIQVTGCDEIMFTGEWRIDTEIEITCHKTNAVIYQLSPLPKLAITNKQNKRQSTCVHKLFSTDVNHGN